jgi:integrase
VEGYNVGEHPSVVRFMRGIKNIRPPTPRYTETWDTDIVINFLKKYDHSNLKELTFKLTMILALVSGQRAQTLSSLKLSDMVEDQDKLTFRISEPLKTKRPGTAVVTFRRFEEDQNICPVHLLKLYFSNTKDVRSDDFVLISFVKPYKSVHVDTIRRWLTNVLSLAGINTDVFTAHSTRSASTSKAKIKQVPMDTILDTAMWSSKSTFAKFYDKPIKDNGAQCQTEYHNAILNVNTLE